MRTHRRRMSVFHRPILRGDLPAVALVTCGGHAGTGPLEPCPPSDDPSTLLAVDCHGRLVPGLADWTLEGSAVVLELRRSEPSASRLVSGWPPAVQPPWLGQPPARTVVFPPRGIRVDFPAGRAAPLGLFADPRLGPPPEDGIDAPGEDGRDRIDRGAAVRTRDERAVDYGRALGRSVTREGFDRTWFVVLRRGVDRTRGEQVAVRIAGAWERSGVAGARRAWVGDVGILPGEDCWPVDPVVIRAARGAGRTDRRASSGTVSHPEDDPVAREIGQRLVSATLPGGEADWLAPSGLAVRPYASGEPPVEPGDLATVVGVVTGSAHPCSVWGELRWVESWFGDPPGDDGTGHSIRVLPVGETAVFRVGPEGGSR